MVVKLQAALTVMLANSALFLEQAHAQLLTVLLINSTAVSLL
jgi:hypothetical protein